MQGPTCRHGHCGRPCRMQSLDTNSVDCRLGRAPDCHMHGWCVDVGSAGIVYSLDPRLLDCPI